MTVPLVAAGAMILAACAFTDLSEFSAGSTIPDAGPGADASVAPPGAWSGEDASPADATTSDVASPDASGCGVTTGAPMLRVGSFCIDTREVTAKEYAAFLASNPPLDGQPTECAWNVSYRPTTDVASDELPARYVDWCDARAYCAWAGKRLCGSIGGGPGDYDAPAPSSDEWLAACSAGGTRSYPYGASFEAAACNGTESTSGGTAPRAVGTMPACVGGYPALFDMSGNVREWTNACNAASEGGIGACLVRGGSADDLAAELACAARKTDPRNYTTVRLGIRCCHD